MQTAMPFQPLVLVAGPQLVDPLFKKSTILLLQHNNGGSFGFIVNSPLPIELSEFADKQSLNCHPVFSRKNVLCGGPVEPYRGWLLHGVEHLPEKQQIIPGLYLSSSQESLKICLERGLEPFRLILGCSSWQGNQLEREIEHGSWIAVEADLKYIFYCEAQDIWDGILHDLPRDPVRMIHADNVH